MHVQILKENLDKASQTVVRFVGQRSQLPVLSYVHLKASKDGILFRATDLNRSIEILIAGKMIESGDILIPASVFSDLVKSLDLGVVDLELKEDRLRIESGSSKAFLQVGDMNAYPSWVTLGSDWVSLGEMEREVLVEAISKVGFSASSDDTRPVLTGMLWEVKKGTLVATDGYRLSLFNSKSICLSIDGLDLDSLLLRASFLFELQKAILDTNGNVEILYHEKLSQVAFKMEQMVLRGGLIEGEYPQYKAIVPSKTSVQCELDRQSLLQALRRVLIFAKESGNIVKVSVTKDALELSANAPMLGEGTVTVGLKDQSTGEGTIAFNGKYLVDFLSRSDHDEVTFGMNESLQPGLFSYKEDISFRYVVMPVRVKE